VGPPFRPDPWMKRGLSMLSTWVSLSREALTGLFRPCSASRVCPSRNCKRLVQSERGCRCSFSDIQRKVNLQQKITQRQRKYLDITDEWSSKTLHPGGLRSRVQIAVGRQKPLPLGEIFISPFHCCFHEQGHGRRRGGGDLSTAYFLN